MRLFVTCQFEGFHCWPDAPEEHKYLRDLHRHMFHVRVEIETTSDRQVEFIELKRAVEENLRFWHSTQDVRTWSCETWARHIFNSFSGVVLVSVSEDDENGAIVTAADCPERA